MTENGFLQNEGRMQVELLGGGVEVDEEGGGGG